MARFGLKGYGLPKVKLGTTILEKTDGLIVRFREMSNGEFKTPGEAIDYLTGVSLDISEQAAAELARFCESKREESELALADCERGGAEEMQLDSAKRTVDSYSRLEDHFRRFISEDELSEYDNPMRRVDLADGSYVVLPDEDGWVSINEDDARYSAYVYVVEIKNGAKYSAPHFVFYSSDAKKSLSRDAVLHEVGRIWPDIKRVQEDWVKPIYDNEGRMINYKEVDKAPCIGVFEVRDSTSFGPTDKAPYGAMVFRR